MRALAWTNVNFGKRQLCVERGDWRGDVSTTKGSRTVYTTSCLPAPVRRSAMAIRVLVLAGVVGLLIATPTAREQLPISTVRQWEYVIVTQWGFDVSVCYPEPAGCRMETLRG